MTRKYGSKAFQMTVYLPERLLTDAEVARIFNVTVGYLRNRRCVGKPLVRPLPLTGGLIRYSPADVAAALEGRAE